MLPAREKSPQVDREISNDVSAVACGAWLVAFYYLVVNFVDVIHR